MYPRPGYPIVPKALEAFLDVPVPITEELSIPVDLRLKELDETAWKRFDDQICLKLAEIVISRLRESASLLRHSSNKLPVPAQLTNIDCLQLDVRTYNCLRHEGFGEHPEFLTLCTYDSLLSIRGFGVRSLLDLICALETYASHSSPSDTSPTDGSDTDDNDHGPLQVTAESVHSLKKLLSDRRPLTRQLKEQNLPKLPDAVKIDDLDLQIRTYNCLIKDGFKDCGELSGISLKRLLAIRGFGLKCLVDLLTAIEPFAFSSTPSPPNGELKSKRNLTAGSPRQVETALRQLRTEAKRVSRARWSKQIYRTDPRLGKYVATFGLHTDSVFQFVTGIMNDQQAISTTAEVTRQLRRLRKEVRSLTNLNLEQELSSFVPTGNDRNMVIFARRFGWDSGSGATLDAVGTEFGITRERVRQVCSRVERLLQNRKTFTPVLDRTLRMISEFSVTSADEIEAQLKLKGITKKGLRLEGILKAARLFGREVTFALDELHGKRIVIASEHQGLAKVVVGIARKSVEHWGVSTTEDVAAQASERLSVPITPESVAHLLRGRDDLKWLDETGGWFWLTSVPRNRLFNQIRKIMSVARTIEASELRSGVSRHHRMKGVAPPQRVLLEFCREIPWCRVDGKTITPQPIPDWQDVLSDTEQLFVEILREHGLVMQRARLEELCLASGMNRATFYVYLDYSPILNRYAAGVYGLRGANVSSAFVQGLIPKTRRRTRVTIDYGWTAEGHIWIGYNLSAGMINSGVASLPAGIKRYVEGNFSLKTEDGLPVGTLVAAPGNIWGLGPFFRRRGGEPGDYLLVILNLSRRVATLRIGDSYLLDTFRQTS